jgi:hypothetical protein
MWHTLLLNCLSQQSCAESNSCVAAIAGFFTQASGTFLSFVHVEDEPSVETCHGFEEQSVGLVVVGLAGVGAAAGVVHTSLKLHS